MKLKQVVVVRKDLNMRKGKIAAQAAHAAMMFLRDQNFSLSETDKNWFYGDMSKVVVGVNSEKELLELTMKAKEIGVKCHVVKDLGKTEFKGVETITCAAFGPNDEDCIDRVTRHLNLI